MHMEKEVSQIFLKFTEKLLTNPLKLLTQKLWAIENIWYSLISSGPSINLQHRHLNLIITIQISKQYNITQE